VPGTSKEKCWCFPHGGFTPTSEFVCVLPFPDGDAKRHKDLSWFGQEKALRPAGERRVCIILHLSACTGVDTSVVWNEMVYGSSTAYECCLLWSLACVVSCFLISSQVSPFMVPRRSPRYKYRRQSRGRQRYGALTYSRPPYRRGLEPSRLGSLMMITRAPVSCSVHHLGLAYLLHACTSWRRLRRDGRSVVIRRPTLPQEGNMSGRGSDAV